MILVRHAKSVVDPTAPAAEWGLAPGATEAAEQLGRVLTASRVVASTEPKAIGTGAALGLGPVESFAAFCEVTRPFYDDPTGLEQAVAAWFAGQDVDGWERRDHAVRRFTDGIDQLDEEGLVVVTHGTVMTAWLQSRGLVDDALGFWSQLRMPDAWALSPTLTRCLPP